MISRHAGTIAALAGILSTLADLLFRGADMEDRLADVVSTGEVSKEALSSIVLRPGPTCQPAS